MATLTLQVLCSILLIVSYLSPNLAKSDTYIIHMDSSAMPKAFFDHHSWYLATLSSTSDNPKATTTTTSNLIYTYTSSIHGFSASLTPSQLEALQKSPGYISYTPDRPLTMHTTHTSQFLGLSSASGAWSASSHGQDVIIGFVDTGIWPESQSFREDGMTKIPSRWKGECVSGTHFNSSLCNKKLIGARFFNKGLLAKNPKLHISMNSPRDTHGHGTHTSSTAAGNFVKGASYFGYATGISKGMAPRARIAMYKAAWSYGVYASDVLAAIDQAIQDGVDILSLSLGFVLEESFLEDDPIAIATFAAMEKGVVVAASAGNEGPFYGTLTNGAPWLLTVAAGTIDREFDGILSLGNGMQITFVSLYPGNSSISKVPLVFLDSCQSVEQMKKNKNKIIVCKDNLSITNQIENAKSAGLVYGAIFISNYSIPEFVTKSSFPAAFLGLHDGQTVLDYIKNNSNPRGSLIYHKTVIGTKPAPMVDSYSSRGPYPTCPFVLKPDLFAPGSSILASWCPTSPVAELQSHFLFSKFNLESGTSMAAPHVAGVAALIKQVHPDWSPAAIRSALMTTASSQDNTFSPIKDKANNKHQASPLAIGAGHINPNKALDPGLVYDATSLDYVKLLCAMNYTATEIRIITRSTIYNCVNVNKSLDLNYPSFIAFFNENDSNSKAKVVQEFRRTVTNVRQGTWSYSAKLTGMNGFKVKVEPEKLVFKKKYEKQSYKLSLEGPKVLKEVVVHGSLSWVDDDGKYVVRSPIVATSLDSDSPLRA
ncbi:subtilisin-like protease SBT1.9 [Fagus crenata]